MQIIPLTQDPAQEMRVTLDGTKYDIFVRYNSRGGYWSFDLYRKDVLALAGVKIALGADLVHQYALQIDGIDFGALVAHDLSGTGVDANELEDLGERVELLYLTPQERDDFASEAAAIAGEVEPLIALAARAPSYLLLY
ncbi:hypothetical protein N9K16_01615 [Alphaproteobacteria bacterium]|jgi:hypothetical protein|nr:hypothetical protein [Alphaproteobacteria bacterium]